MQKVLFLFFSLVMLSMSLMAQTQAEDSLSLTTNQDEMTYDTIVVESPMPQPTQSQPMAARLKIGYFSYEEALCAMPQYAIVQANLKALRSQYDDEMLKGEKEFNERYETFLEEQNIMAPAIREKRQSELQSMMERNVAFRNEANRLLAQAEKDAMAPLHATLSETLARVAEQRAYIMVVNTDSNACPYLSPTMAEDITTLVIDALK